MKETTPIKLAAKDKLIVALDVDNEQRARELVAMLRGIVGMFKIGSQLFTAVGPSIVREIVKAGSHVFLDLKFHDIPNTVAAAGVEATRLGVSIFNVHAGGGSEMMRLTADKVTEAAEREGLERPRVIAVTVLTSADALMLAATGVTSSVGQQVVALAQLASASTLDGVVASSLETPHIRAAVPSRDFLIVTPGVRPAGTDHGDQKRVLTPAEAVRAGSDYLVVGRPIIDARDPVVAAQAIVEEIKSVQLA
jgi:orotidine-5'-phosphate decarboxylase